MVAKSSLYNTKFSLFVFCSHWLKKYFGSNLKISAKQKSCFFDLLNIVIKHTGFTGFWESQLENKWYMKRISCYQLTPNNLQNNGTLKNRLFVAARAVKSLLNQHRMCSRTPLGIHEFYWWNLLINHKSLTIWWQSQQTPPIKTLFGRCIFDSDKTLSFLSLATLLTKC